MHDSILINRVDEFFQPVFSCSSELFISVSLLDNLSSWSRGHQWIDFAKRIERNKINKRLKKVGKRKKYILNNKINKYIKIKKLK